MTPPTELRGTALPWGVHLDSDFSWWVVERDTHRRVCYVGHDSDARAESDATLIIQAANNHAPLVEACEMALAAYDTDDISFDALKIALTLALQSARGDAP